MKTMKLLNKAEKVAIIGDGNEVATVESTKHPKSTDDRTKYNNGIVCYAVGQFDYGSNGEIVNRCIEQWT